jgi:hypothetical protein
MTESPGVGPEIFGEDYLHFYAPLWPTSAPTARSS